MIAKNAKIERSLPLVRDSEDILEKNTKVQIDIQSCSPEREMTQCIVPRQKPGARFITLGTRLPRLKLPLDK
jgi:hypothetical protein